MRCNKEECVCNGVIFVCKCVRFQVCSGSSILFRHANVE